MNTWMSNYYDRYLEWIDNAKDGATVHNFLEDWDPIGGQVLADLINAGRVKVTGHRLRRTE